jgi:hypothetical protein
MLFTVPKSKAIYWLLYQCKIRLLLFVTVEENTHCPIQSTSARTSSSLLIISCLSHGRGASIDFIHDYRTGGNAVQRRVVGLLRSLQSLLSLLSYSTQAKLVHDSQIEENLSALSGHVYYGLCGV